MYPDRSWISRLTWLIVSYMFCFPVCISGHFARYLLLFQLLTNDLLASVACSPETQYFVMQVVYLEKSAVFRAMYIGHCLGQAWRPFSRQVLLMTCFIAAGHHAARQNDASFLGRSHPLGDSLQATGGIKGNCCTSNDLRAIDDAYFAPEFVESLPLTYSREP